MSFSLQHLCYASKLFQHVIRLEKKCLKRKTNLWLMKLAHWLKVFTMAEEINELESILQFWFKRLWYFKYELLSLASHASGKKHSAIPGLKSLNVGNTFFKSLGNSETSVKATGSLQTIKSMVEPVRHFRLKFFRCSKLWKIIFSPRLCLGLNDLFKACFPTVTLLKHLN